MQPSIVYSETGIFMAWERYDGRIDNGWFAGPLDLVRWLKLFAGPMRVVRSIVVLRVG